MTHVVIIAAVSMLLSDIIATVMTQAEARNRAQLAGLLDVLCWLVAIVVTFETVTALQGHNTALKVVVVVAVSAANYAGTVIGTKIGKRWVKADDTVTLAQRVEALESIAAHPDTP